MRKHTYRTGRLKTKHHIIKQAMPYIKEVLRFEWIKLIVPDIIDNSSHGQNRMKLSRATENGFNLTFGGAAAQKFRVVCEPSDENRKAIEAAIKKVDS